MSDPSLLVTRPTATDPALAPDGSDLLYILAPAPNLARGRIDWDRTGQGYADTLAATENRSGLYLESNGIFEMVANLVKNTETSATPTSRP